MAADTFREKFQTLPTDWVRAAAAFEDAAAALEPDSTTTFTATTIRKPPDTSLSTLWALRRHPTRMPTSQILTHGQILLGFPPAPKSTRENWITCSIRM